MMEVADLPVVARLLQHSIDPRALRRVQKIAVEHEEPDVALGICVVADAAHVEPRVSLLTRVVVVPERSIKADARLQQRPIRLLELRDEVLGLLTSVQVIAQHDDHLERKPFVKGHHLPADIIFRKLARAVVADRGKLQRGRSVRQRQTLRASRPCAGQEQQQDCARPLHVRTVLYFLISHSTDASRPSSRLMIFASFLMSWSNGTDTSYRSSLGDDAQSWYCTPLPRNACSICGRIFSDSLDAITRSNCARSGGSSDSRIHSTRITKMHNATATANRPDPAARPTASDTSSTPASLGSSICARYRTSPAAPAIANARARLSATMIMTAAPTMAIKTCVWMTCDDRRTSTRRIGLITPSAAPSSAAIGRIISACSSEASWRGSSSIIGALRSRVAAQAALRRPGTHGFRRGAGLRRSSGADVR